MELACTRFPLYLYIQGKDGIGIREVYGGQLSVCVRFMVL